MPLALAIVGVGLVAPAAHAVVSTLYVMGGTGPCSDSGPGSSSQPFCTISKAAAVVQPGQTVVVGYGNYPETVTISAKGTATAPIKFIGQSDLGDDLASWVGVSGGSTAVGDHAFVLDGAQYVTISGFGNTANKESVLVQNSQHVTVDQIFIANPKAATPDVRVAGSAGVTVSRSILQFGLELDAGTSGATVVNNVITNGPFPTGGLIGPALLATDATGTTIVNNTLIPTCNKGIDLEGASTGSTIENNIVDVAAGGGQCLPPVPAVTVASGSTSGTTGDYNVVHAGPGGTLYSWAGTAYSDLPSFTAATGQGHHDVATDPKLVPIPNNFATNASVYPSEGAPEIDSADGNAAPAADIAGHGRVDDPLVANTGTGAVKYADRGAFEFQDPIAFLKPTMKHVPGGGPLDVNITTGVTGAWSNHVTFTYNFQDGTPNLVTTSTAIRHDYPSARDASVSLSATDGFGSTSQADQNSLTSAVVGADYTPLAPVRVLDTRHAIGVPTTTPVPANSDVVLPVAGVRGIPSGGGLSAVVLNVTATAPTAAGHLTVYPDGNPLVQNASTLDFTAGQVVPNLVTVQVNDGKVRFHNASSGTVHIVADAEGYYADSGDAFKSVTPVRVLDTRHAIGVPTTTPVPANGHLQLDLSSKVPSGTKAVTLNVTVTHPTAGGYITVYPDATTAPTASNLNFVPGQTVPNLVTVPINNGKVDFKNGSAGTVDLIADLAGYYGGASTGATFGLLPEGPWPVFNSTTSGTGPIGANASLHVVAAWFPNVGLVPASGTGALINVTVTGPTAGGYLTVYPDGASRPTASNLNFSSGQTVANMVSTVFGTDGFDLYNGSAGHTDVVIELEAYFVAPLA